MKEKISFLIKNVFKRTIQRLFDLDKPITFNFNVVEIISPNFLNLEKAQILEENPNNAIVEIQFENSAEYQAIKNLPENDFQGRVFESISAIYRYNLASKTKIFNPLLDYKVHCRAPFFKPESLLGKQYKGSYGIEKIDGTDTEHEKFVLDAYSENFLSKVKIFEVKTSRTGDIEASLNSALQDINFNCPKEHLIFYLQNHYQISDIKDYTEIEKVVSFWGAVPPKSKFDVFQKLLDDPKFLDEFLKVYGKSITKLAKASVSTFEFNFFPDKSFPNKEKFLSILEKSLEVVEP